MKDIDFDELDRAVSSLLIPKEKTDNSNLATVDAVTKDQKSDDEAHQPQPNTTQPSVIPHRSGRFMDVVPAGSSAANKDKQIAAPPVSAPVIPEKTVEGMTTTVATLQPLQLTKPNEPAGDDAPDETKDSTSMESSHKNGETTESDINPNDSRELDSFSGWGLDAAAAESPAKLSETPFLADTKVVKRPLGAYSDLPAEADEVPGKDLPDSTLPAGSKTSSQSQSVFHATRLELDEATSSSQLDDIAAAKEITPEPVVTDYLPPELEQAVVAVESDTAAMNARDAAVKSRAESKSAALSSNMTASSVVSAAAAMSIPKQYQEKPELAGSNQHLLFDTKEYHPPLPKPVDSNTHKHTALWVILALLLLIATAAGFGYWLYLQI